VNDAAYRIDGRPASEQAFYAAACDPRRSIVVEACAGAGKTWMLVSRILRALLDGAQAHEILALTFTRKAAGEMRARLDEWLRGFSVPGVATPADLDRLALELRNRGVDDAQAHTLAPALAVLHERLLKGGRSVAIRSFHAWFAQLVAAAPLDTLRALGLPAQPELIEDTEPLADELFARFHAVVQDDTGLRADYADLIHHHRLSRVTTWLRTAWQRRLEIERADGAGTLEPSVPPAATLWPGCAGLPCPQAQVLRTPLSGELGALAQALAAQEGKAIPQAAARALLDALVMSEPQAAFSAACAALMTAKGETKKRMGDLPAHEAACESLREIGRQADQQQAHEDHGRMVRLVRVLLREYARLKLERGLADMGDLESAALALLSDPALAGWLQLRLDAQLKHLLIDEFQDTSPLQWHALFGWLSAYAGAGGGMSGQRPPSVFIVGDPKQSIYRFRRAEPRVFEAAKEFVVDGLDGSVLACDHTRRCATGVVDAINAVFEPVTATGEWPGFRPHTTAAAEAGRLSCLPDVLRPPREGGKPGDRPVPVWRDTLTQPRHEPEEVLRMHEARHVALAIAELVAQGRRPGDIMVLARKRVALRAVADALAEAQLPHVMPEAMSLGDEPEARDLLAVLDVLASPGHDLSLAQALKSPLFGASDADLLALSRAAAGSSWWTALVEGSAGGAAWGGALGRARTLLAGWHAAMAWLPPHDLLDRIVHEGELMPRLAATVPPGRRALATQIVEALLAASLQLDGGRYATPYGFVRALRSRPVEAAAVAASDAVKLLTVHGAKGLEAAVVFVVDADPNRGSSDAGSLLVDWPVESAAPRRVAFVAVEARPPPSLQRLQEEESREREREELNALYVAMTRAAEHLVVSRTEPFQRPAGMSWWQRVSPCLQAWTPVPAATLQAGSVQESPTWIDLPPLCESAAEPVRPASDEPPQDPDRALLGSALHRVLEWVAGGQWHADGELSQVAAAAAAALGLPAQAAGAVAQGAAAVLASPDCRRFFDPAAAAWAGNEVPVLVDGQQGRIDRLVAFDDADGRIWWVLDYKLDADPGSRPEYRAQMDAYVRAIRALQPGDRVAGAFITASGRVVLHEA